MNHYKMTLPKRIKIGGLVYKVIEEKETENEVERISEAVMMFIADNPKLVKTFIEKLNRKC